jgi:hypothetical protein
MMPIETGVTADAGGPTLDHKVKFSLPGPAPRMSAHDALSGPTLKPCARPRPTIAGVELVYPGCNPEPDSSPRNPMGTWAFDAKRYWARG